MKLSIQSLSLHPKLAAGFDFLFGLVLWWWLLNVGTLPVLLMWVLARLMSWLLLIIFGFYPPGFSRWRHFLTLCLFASGLALLLIFIDSKPILFLVYFFVVSMSAGSFALIPASGVALSFTAKPWRRWRLLMSLAGLMGLWSGLFATQTFQFISPLTWWAPFLSGALAAVVGLWWWYEYEVPVKTARFSFLVLAFLFTELAAVINFLPIGYFASGFLLAWVWYLVWLFLRFHHTAEGIRWKKQTAFLVANGIFLALYVFLLRWH